MGGGHGSRSRRRRREGAERSAARGSGSRAHLRLPILANKRARRRASRQLQRHRMRGNEAGSRPQRSWIARNEAGWRPASPEIDPRHRPKSRFAGCERRRRRRRRRGRWRRSPAKVPVIPLRRMRSSERGCRSSEAGSRAANAEADPVKRDPHAAKLDRGQRARMRSPHAGSAVASLARSSGSELNQTGEAGSRPATMEVDPASPAPNQRSCSRGERSCVRSGDAERGGSDAGVGERSGGVRSGDAGRGGSEVACDPATLSVGERSWTWGGDDGGGRAVLLRGGPSSAEGQARGKSRGVPGPTVGEEVAGAATGVAASLRGERLAVGRGAATCPGASAAASGPPRSLA